VEKLDVIPLDIKVTLLSKPPPSDYAKAESWTDLQKLAKPMLCMRPVKCRGLPIFLLHSVFATYLSLSKEPLPATRPARFALKAARALCDTMGDYFVNELARRDAFLQTVEPLFSRWVTAPEAMSEEATEQEASLDEAIESTRTCMTIPINETVMVLTSVSEIRGPSGPAKHSRFTP
jgi:hypothetical protein